MTSALKVVPATPKKPAGELRRIVRRSLRFPVDRLLPNSGFQTLKELLGKEEKCLQ